MLIFMKRPPHFNGWQDENGQNNTSGLSLSITKPCKHMPTTKYFLICASKDHVLHGVKGGFAQAGHGRKDYMSKLAKEDWIVFYSAKEEFEGGTSLQKFTAIGRVTDEEPYEFTGAMDFKPYRRNVDFRECHEADIRPLLDRLGFIKNKKRWGFYLISGFRQITKEDFEVIEGAMI